LSERCVLKVIERVGSEVNGKTVLGVLLLFVLTNFYLNLVLLGKLLFLLVLSSNLILVQDIL